MGKKNTTYRRSKQNWVGRKKAVTEVQVEGNLVEREGELLTRSYQANIVGFLRMKLYPISQWWRLVPSSTNHHELFNLELS